LEMAIEKGASVAAKKRVLAVEKGATSGKFFLVFDALPIQSFF
jgi:hypothetical protein